MALFLMGKTVFLTEPTVDGIKNTILKLRNFDKNELEIIRKNSHNTVLQYTSHKCAENYLQQIFKIL